MLVVGKRVFPRLLLMVSRTGSRELFTLCVVSAAIGVAFGSAELFGVSFALGAFFAGMMIGESALSQRAADESLPLREAFAVLFFVSVGMLFDPAVLVEHPAAGARGHRVIMVGKSLAAIRPGAALRLRPADRAHRGREPGADRRVLVHPRRARRRAGLLPPEGQSLILAGALISISLNPLLFAAVGPVARGARVASSHFRRARTSSARCR